MGDTTSRHGRLKSGRETKGGGEPATSFGYGHTACGVVYCLWHDDDDLKTIRM